MKREQACVHADDLCVGDVFELCGSAHIVVEYAKRSPDGRYCDGILVFRSAGPSDGPCRGGLVGYGQYWQRIVKV